MIKGEALKYIFQVSGNPVWQYGHSNSWGAASPLGDGSGGLTSGSGIVMKIDNKRGWYHYSHSIAPKYFDRFTCASSTTALRSYPKASRR